MSFWDRVGKVAEAVGGSLYAPAGFVVDVASAPWRDEEEYNGFVNTLASRAAARFVQASKPLDVLAGPVDEKIGRAIMGTLNWAEEDIWSPYISRGASAASLVGPMTESEELHGGPVSAGETWLNLFDRDTWGAAWRAADHLSPGQSFAILRSRGPRALGPATEVLDDQGGAVDPASATDLARVDWSKGQARVQSGMADAVARWYLDPFTLGGKAAKVGKVRVWDRPITRRTNIDEAIESNRVSRFIGELHKRETPELRMNWLLRNPTIRQAEEGPAIAELLARTDDTEQAKAVLKAGMVKDPGALLKLEVERGDLHAALTRLQDTRIPMIEQAMQRSTKHRQWFTAWGGAKLDDLRAETRNLEQSIAERDLAMAAEGSLTQVPRVGVRATVADRVQWDIYQPSRYNVPMRVLRSAGTMRPGIVDFNRPESVTSLARMLDRVGHGVAGDPRYRSGFSAEEKGAMLRSYAAATTEAEKTAAVQAAEQAAIRRIADNLGIGADAADAALKEGWTRRDELMSFLKERAYSGAKGRNGHYLDYVDADGTAVRLPVTLTQLANTTPLIDVDAIGRVMARYRAEIRGDEGGFINTLASARAAAPVAWTSAAAEEAVSALNRFWKPQQLLRLGWPMRVLLDEQMRIMSVVGVMSHLPLVRESLTASLDRGVFKGVRERGKQHQARLEQIDARLGEIDTKIIGAKRPGAMRYPLPGGAQLMGGYDALKSERAALIAERGQTEKLAKMAPERDPFGVGDLTVSGYKVEDAYGGAGQGRNVFGSLAASRPMWARMADDSGRWLDTYRGAGAGVDNLLPKDPGYDRAWARAVNDQIGDDPIARRILQGQDDDTIATWLTRTPEGQEARKRIGRRGGDPHRWVGEIRTHVDHYLPTPELADLALAKRATAKDLHRAMPERDMRPVIHGESLATALGQGKVWGAWNSTVDRLYQALGSAPTDVLSRHPYFVNRYRSRLSDLIEGYDPAGTGTLNEKLLARLTHRAREGALRDVRKTLYELGEESNLAHTLRFVMPFYAAWQESLTRWLGLVTEDPSRLARGALMWQMPDRVGVMVERNHKLDAEGNPIPGTGEQYVALPMPKWAKDHIPGAAQVGDLEFQKNQVSVMVSGDPWFLPGVGPLVAAPVAQMVRDKPDLEESMRYILPYGAGQNVLDQVLPAWAKRAVVAHQAEDNRSYVNTIVRFSAELETERRMGRNDYSDAELYGEARRRAKDFWRMRTVANLVLPVSPQFKSPYQFFWDKAREYRAKYKAGWEERYLADFGEDYFAFTAALSKSKNSVAPTVGGYQASKKYADLLEANPEYGSLIVGDEDSGTFSGAVYAYQFDHQLAPGSTSKERETQDPRAAIGDVQRREGWIAYRKISSLVEAELVDRGLRSLSAKGAEDLALLKRAFRAQLYERYPQWRKDYEEFDRGGGRRVVAWMSEHAEDPRFQDRPGWSTLRTYLQSRQVILSLLAARRQGGGSINLQAKANDDLRTLWETYVGDLAERDLNFADLRSRWLEADRMEEGE